MNLRFDAISQLTPKRLSTDGGIDSWYPYYAGFSSRFAFGALKALNLPSGAVVIDPWLGSGTTAVAASQLGLKLFGSDLNPFAIVLSYAKLISQIECNSLVADASNLLSQIKESNPLPTYEADPLSLWLPPVAGSLVRRLVKQILPEISANSLGNLTAKNACILLCLIQSASHYAAKAEVSNPTWTCPGKMRIVRAAYIHHAFMQSINNLAENIRQHGLRQPATGAEISLADARSMPLPGNSADAILTSPPYCTRIDYAVKNKFELAVLGLNSEESFRELRRRLMGTTMIRKEMPRDVPKEWPRSVIDLLEAMRRHPSHRSESYYFHNSLQYFSDAYRSIGEINRILKLKARALMVLQSSYYKEIYIDLPQLFSDMAKSFGLNVNIVGTIPISRVMTSLNVKSKRYRRDRAYSEAILCFQHR
jgi:hypothetical protein